MTYLSVGDNGIFANGYNYLGIDYSVRRYSLSILVEWVILIIHGRAEENRSARKRGSNN